MTLQFMKQLRYASLFFVCSAMMVALDYQSICQDVQEYDYLNWTNSYVTFLIDSLGNKYVVKQLKIDGRADLWVKIVCEVVALEVGHSIGVAQNYACIIPAGATFIGKETEVPATLHTHAPGIRFDEYPLDIFPGLSLKQRDTQGKSVGLTRDLIYQMSRHKDFPAMVALDTFVGNPARHKHNFFYDESSDTFYGIDMGASFYRDLCNLSLRTMQVLARDQMSLFSDAELEALMVYCQTLKKLTKLYKPTSLCKKLEEYAQYAGIFDDRYFDSNVQNNCNKYLDRCKLAIYMSYDHANQLIDVLELLFQKTES